MNLDKIIAESIDRVLNEVLYHSLSNWDEKTKYKKQDLSSINWLRIGEVQNPVWSNKLMKNIYTTYYFEVNSDFTQEMEELKDMSVSRYLMTIRNMQKDLNGLNLDVFRFINDNGEVQGVYFDDIKDNVKIYDEYKDSPWADILLDYSPTKEAYHREFLNNLNMQDGKLILTHSSDHQITDGFIKNSPSNSHSYTPQSDMGYAYFWGSKNKGSDQSNSGGYTYFCVVNPNDVYDYSSNLENFKSQNEALSKYPFIAYYWQQEQTIAVKTKGGAKISYIEHNGKYYSPDWNEI